MKPNLFRLLAAVFLLTTCPAPGHAQEQPSQMRLNILTEIDGSRAAEFDRAWQTIASHAKKNKFPYYTVVSESGNQRLILLIIKSYADLSTISERIDQYVRSDDAELRKAVRDFQDIVVTYRSYVSRIAGDLTYSPAGSYRSGFVRYAHYTIQTENKAAVSRLVKDYRDMLEQADVSSAFHARWLALGSDGQVLELLQAANSPEEMAQFEKEIQTKVDPLRRAEFQSRLNKLTQSVSHRYWKPRPDLSISSRR